MAIGDTQELYRDPWLKLQEVPSGGLTGPSGGKPLYLLLKHQLLQAEWGNNSHTWGMVTFGEPEAPMPLDFLPGYAKDPFPLRSCISPLWLPNTVQIPPPSDFRSDSQPLFFWGLFSVALALLSHVCLVFPSLVKPQQKQIFS